MTVCVNEGRANGSAGHVKVAPLKWGSDIAVTQLLERLQIDSFDVVIGSDIFYFQSSLVNGLKTARVALLGNQSNNKSSSTATAATRRKVFYCASFVRSDRMDEDMDEIPSSLGFLPHRLVSEDDVLRIYSWELEVQQHFVST
jgi:hypothetical protein